MNRPEIPDACMTVGEQLEAYLDGALSPTENSEVASHLASCPECRADYALARRVNDALHSLPVERCPDRVIERVYARVAPPAMTLGDRLRSMFWRPVLVGGFAALLLAVTAMIGQRQLGQIEVAQEELIRAEQEARWALTYVGLLGGRAGRTVKSEVIEDRVLIPVVRTLERSLERDNKDDKREVRNAG